MPPWIRRLIILTVLPVWAAYLAVAFFAFHQLPAYESLLVPGFTAAAVMSPEVLSKWTKKVAKGPSVKDEGDE